MQTSTLGEGYLKEPFVMQYGYIDLPAKPGLGIELDEEALAAKRMEKGEKPPLWFHEDGSVAD